MPFYVGKKIIDHILFVADEAPTPAMSYKQYMHQLSGELPHFSCLSLFSCFTGDKSKAFHLEQAFDLPQLKLERFTKKP